MSPSIKRLLTLQLTISAFLSLGAVVFGVFTLGHLFHSWGNKETVKVGVLHSLTGIMAISEQSVADATLFAIQEINASGGVLGRQIEPVTADAKSDPVIFKKESRRLLEEEHVSAVFGCWTSECRKTVKPVFEEKNILLFYPVQYEGLETSSHIIYTGSVSNQQTAPAVQWAVKNLGRRFFIVGSDYIYPVAASRLIKDSVEWHMGEIVGEEYIDLHSSEVEGVVQKIKAAEPDVILNTINGETNVAFFAALRRAGITPDKIPTVSFSISEVELQRMDKTAMAGDYAVKSYFQSIRTETNRRFVQKFQDAFGAGRVVSEAMEAAYYGTHLWARAVREAGTLDTQDVIKALSMKPFNAPEGIVSIDPANLHTWKPTRIGRIREDGQFDIVWDSIHPIRPDPYPAERTRAEWEAFLTGIQTQWGGAWSRPSHSKAGAA